MPDQECNDQHQWPGQALSDPPGSAPELRICTAYKECGKAQTCRHAKPHACEQKGMHRFSECYDSEPRKLLSACIPIKDGKIPVSKWETCKCCGHSKRVTEYEEISLQNAECQRGTK